jgi:hypothetical protein
MSYFQAATAEDEENYQSKKEGLIKGLTSLLNEFKGPFFRGNEFSLVDTSVIPVIQRLTLTKNLRADLNLSDEISTKLDQWLNSTLSMDEVINSIPENFSNDYNEYLIKRNSYIHRKE